MEIYILVVLCATVVVAAAGSVSATRSHCLDTFPDYELWQLVVFWSMCAANILAAAIQFMKVLG